MKSAMSLVWVRKLVLPATVLFSYSACAQNAPPASKPQRAEPVTITECEQGSNGCATWTFLGPLGNGRGPNDEMENLSFSINGKTIVFTRTDSTGKTAGLRATYTGTADEDGFSGKFTSSWPGHWEQKSGHWYATPGKAPEGPPSVMHFCAVNCFTLHLENGQFVARDNNGAIFSTWTAESFTRESVILRRTDSNGFGGVYAGRISDGGGTIANQTFNGRPDGALITWGSSLNLIPGSNAERASRCSAGQSQWCAATPSPSISMGNIIDSLHLINGGLELLEHLRRLSNN